MRSVILGFVLATLSAAFGSVAAAAADATQLSKLVAVQQGVLQKQQTQIAELLKRVTALETSLAASDATITGLKTSLNNRFNSLAVTVSGPTVSMDDPASYSGIDPNAKDSSSANLVTTKCEAGQVMLGIRMWAKSDGSYADRHICVTLGINPGAPL